MQNHSITFHLVTSTEHTLSNTTLHRATRVQLKAGLPLRHYVLQFCKFQY
jgi:hypothetical protein